MAFVPASSAPHAHNYSSEATIDATCTEAGLMTYRCDCGDSYTEVIEALGHSFDDGFCVECGADEIVDIPDNGETEPDNGETEPDNGETEPDNGETEPDNGETAPDNGETEPDNGETEPEKPEDPKEDEKPTEDNQPNNGDSTENEPLDGEQGEDGEENLGFFARIWRAILNFFAKLFGGKKD